MIEVLIIAALVIWSAVVVFKKSCLRRQTQSLWRCPMYVINKVGQHWQNG